jgi:hypothetical protein
MALSDLDRRILWVWAGGRCTLCKRYLLEGELTTVEVPLQNPLPVSDRDTVDNVVLACSTYRNEADQFEGRRPARRDVPAGAYGARLPRDWAAERPAIGRA